MLDVVTYGYPHPHDPEALGPARRHLAQDVALVLLALVVAAVSLAALRA